MASSGSSALQEEINQMREAEAGPDDPIKTVRRQVQADGSSESPLANLSSDARDITGIAPGDTIEISVYREMLQITVVREGRDGDGC
jgi:hypothetical protein